MGRKSRRPLMLLEVLIAFALVVLCIFPLIAPHVFILKAQYQFNNRIELDQTVSRLYAILLQKAYRHEIPWDAFKQKQIFPLEKELLEAAGAGPAFPYQGSYQFAIDRFKGNDTQPFSANVVNLKISFEPKGGGQKTSQSVLPNPPMVYEYKFFAARINEEHEQNNKEEKTAPSDAH